MMATAFLLSASGLGPLSSSAGKEQYLIIVNLILAALKCNWVLGKRGTNRNYSVVNRDIFKIVVSE